MRPFAVKGIFACRFRIYIKFEYNNLCSKLMDLLIQIEWPLRGLGTRLIFLFLFFSNFETNDKHTLTIMKEMTAACRQNPLCAKLDPFDRVACIRRCVSPMCYNQIYDSSPLEPGEIDTKYPGYKSCFHKLWKSKYRESLNIT